MKVLQNVKSGFANFKDLFKIFLENNDEDNYDMYINSSDVETSRIAQELLNAEQAQEFNPDSGIVKKNSKVTTKARSRKSSSIPKSPKKVLGKEEPENEK